MKRNDKLLLDVAQQFENASTPMHSEWLDDNKVTLDECGSLCDKLGAIIRGYVRAPRYIQMAVLASSAMPNKPAAEFVVAKLEQKRCMEKVARLSA